MPENILIITEDEVFEKELKGLFEENGKKAEVFAPSVLSEDFDFSAYDGMTYVGQNAVNVLNAAKAAVKHEYGKFVYVGNILSYFDKTYPDKNLAKNNSFVKNANECVNAAVAFHDELNVSVVELPFFAGHFPQEFQTANGALGFDCKKFYLAPVGGMPEILPINAAAAVYAATEYGENGGIYPVCDFCRKYKDILKDYVDESKKIYDYPEEFAWLTALIKKKELKKKGAVPAFDLKTLYSELLLENLYLDAAYVKRALKLDVILE